MASAIVAQFELTFRVTSLNDWLTALKRAEPATRTAPEQVTRRLAVCHGRPRRRDVSIERGGGMGREVSPGLGEASSPPPPPMTPA